MRQLEVVNIPSLVSHSAALLFSVPLRWAWDRHLIWRRTEHMCGIAIPSRGFVNIYVRFMEDEA
jgi:hypothetical protein